MGEEVFEKGKRKEDFTLDVYQELSPQG